MLQVAKAEGLDPQCFWFYLKNNQAILDGSLDFYFGLLESGWKS